MTMLLIEVYGSSQTQPSPPLWFDIKTLFTAAGSTAAVIAVTSVLQRMSPKFPARWFALGLSLALGILSIPALKQDWNVVNFALGLLNGVMTYAATVGVNTVATAPSDFSGGTREIQAQKISTHSYRWWP